MFGRCILFFGRFLYGINAIRGQFRVAFCLCVKSSLRAKPFTWKCVSPTGSFSCKSKSFSSGDERFYPRTRFETEAQGNSEMAYYKKHVVITIERIYSRVQQPCKFLGMKESVYIRIELNSHRIGLVHQHGRFIVLEHQYGCHDFMCIRSIDGTQHDGISKRGVETVWGSKLSKYIFVQCYSKFSIDVHYNRDILKTLA